MNEKSVVIIGGGFGGIATALELANKKLKNLKIYLISNKPDFEYHAALYRYVTGGPETEVAIPLEEIFHNKKVQVVLGNAQEISLEKQEVKVSEQILKYDFLVLALGSETSYFDIPGLKEHSFGFKSLNEAKKLRATIKNQIILSEKITETK
jgi:NADH dehydrogenase